MFYSMEYICPINSYVKIGIFQRFKNLSLQDNFTHYLIYWYVSIHLVHWMLLANIFKTPMGN